ncbi:barstar family protein [Parafrankia sp. FMc2]|uniref:barstar family protein n=1 Tax=Parafrankia sp. FMc2 TaxID=3233196 RepID=UPI0034D4BF7A
MAHDWLPRALLSPQPPWILCGTVPTPPGDADEDGSGVRLVCIDGAETSTEAEMHHQFVERFEFPEYYGRNWDALYECLTDLSWSPAEAYIVDVAHSSRLLWRQRRSIDVLLDVLSSAGEAWALPASRGWPVDEHKVPFHVVLHDSELTANELMNLYSSLGVPLSILSPV